MIEFISKNRITIALTLIAFAIPFIAQAHPGRTASDGCHYCRTNCSSWGVAWDERHCHGGYTAPVTTPRLYTPTPIRTATPKPTVSSTKTPTPTPKVIPGLVDPLVSAKRQDYLKNPHWFRERLINELTLELGDQYYSAISRIVYTLLVDVK